MNTKVKKHDIVVGQELYIVKPPGYGNNYNGIVSRVGRDYFYVGFGRMEKKFSLATLGEYVSPNDNGSGAAQAYLTEKEYLDRVELSIKWQEFNRAVRDAYRRPEHVTLEQIETMLKFVKGE